MYNTIADNNKWTTGSPITINDDYWAVKDYDINGIFLQKEEESVET